MGTYYKTPKEKFEYRMSKQTSVECCIIIEIKERRAINWATGIAFKLLKQFVERRRNRKFTNQRIYEAISLINRYGIHHGVYLRSEYGFAIDEENNKSPEYRYFIPTEQDDINRERSDLEHKEEILGLKKEHLQYHEQITIPQEKQLTTILY